MTNRIIKFRVWDKLNCALFYQDKQGDEEGDAIKRWLVNFSDTYELMQFTGLVDKNGIEIYEGDIITNDISMIKNMPIVVEWMSYCNGWGISSYHPVGEGELKNTYTKIGNIFENPNLVQNYLQSEDSEAIAKLKE